MRIKVKKPSAPCREQLGQPLTYAVPEAWRNTITSVSNADFISTAFAQIDITREAIWATGFSGDPSEVAHYKWSGKALPPMPWFIRDCHNNYVAVSSFYRDKHGLFHRRKDNFGRLYKVMVDDVGTKVPPQKLLLSPNAVVETSPGNYQAWYFLAEPEEDRTRAERLIKGMIASGLTADGSDPGMNGVTRYGRLPIGVNTKMKYMSQIGGPFVQRLAVWSPIERCSVGDIADAYGIDLSMPAPTEKRQRPNRVLMHVQRAKADADNSLLEILGRTGQYIEPVSSLDGAHRIVCPWVHEHTGEDETGTVYFEPSAENAWRGGFKCHHGHCQRRTIADLDNFAARLEQLRKE